MNWIHYACVYLSFKINTADCLCRKKRLLLMYNLSLEIPEVTWGTRHVQSYLRYYITVLNTVKSKEFIGVAGVCVCVCLSVSVCTWTHAFLDSVSKVEGNISGKSLRKTGRRNSIKGTMINTMKGTRRNRSAQVLNSCKHRGDKCWRYKLRTVTQTLLSVPMTMKVCVCVLVSVCVCLCVEGGLWGVNIYYKCTEALLVSFKSSLNIVLPCNALYNLSDVQCPWYRRYQVCKPITYFLLDPPVSFPYEMVSRKS